MGLIFLRSVRVKYLYFLLASIALLIPGRISATHSMGADISYECLGNDNYRIRISFYRDCSGIDAPNSVQVNIQSILCNIDTFAILSPIPGTGQDITPLCPSATSTCNGGTFTGIQEWVYEGIFHFPAQCTDWNLSYSLCCRNGAITTIQYPLSENIYIFSTLNNTISPCNNSPVFSNRPVPFVCQGQQYCFNHGAYDADGDSLVYSVLTPLSVNGSPVQYQNPYSASQPLNSIPAMTFDSQTGDFCITPQSLEVTVMAILVSEYRNGVLIGTVERDIQVTVVSCSNILPVLSGINGTNSFSATTCADVPLCFDIFSTDPDTGQSVSVAWDNAIPSATMNFTGTNRPTGTFCWTPTQADASPNPYCFTASVTDDACPLNGSQIFSYCITVVNVTVDAGPDQTISCGSLATITAIGNTSSGIITYQWSNGVTGTSQQVGPGTYTVTATNGQCTATDDITVSPAAGPTAAFNSQPFCLPNATVFTDNSTMTGGGAITSWLWDFDDGTTSTQPDPSHLFASAGVYNVCLTVTSANNCTSTVCQTVSVESPPVPSFSFMDVCEGSVTSFTNNTSPGNTYLWDFGNGTTSTDSSPSVTYSTSGSYNVTLTATTSSGCSASIQQQILINPSPVADFTNTAIPCSTAQVIFTDASAPTPASWDWNFGNGITSAQQNPAVSLPPGNHTVTLIVTSSTGCVDTVTQTVNVASAFTAPPISPAAMCDGDSVTITATGGIAYQWASGQSTAAITVSPATSTTYVVNVTDANGCADTVAATVTVNQLPSVSAGNDVLTCSGTTLTLTASGATDYIWSNGSTSASLTITTGNSVTYTVTGTDINGCTGSDTVNVTVNPLLTISLPNPTMCNGETDTLDAGYPGATYLWSSGQTTQTISVSSTGIYSVTVTESTGCTGTGQSIVTVNPLPNLSAGNDTSICLGAALQLNATGATGYLWSDGSTTTSINVSPSSTTSYSVTGTSNFGCIATSAITITVNPAVTVNNNTIFICPGHNTILDAGNPGASYTWSTGETTQTIAVSSAGNYTVTVTSITGCSGTGQNVVAVGAPLSNNAATVSACNGVNVTLDAGNQGSSYLWSNGATTQTIVVGAGGNYNVVVTGTDGCTISFSSAVSINPVPVASFSAPPACDYDSIFFINNSNILSGTIVSYNWDFNDGNTSTLREPSHYYGNVGTYNVSLTTISDSGCIDTTVTMVTVHSSPVAVFQGADVCLGVPVNFSENSTVINDVISTWVWDFGDGSTGVGKNPSRNYSTDGNYIVTLIATSSNGCSDTVTNNITIHPLPDANAGPDVTFCSGSSVTLGDTAQSGVTYNWFPATGLSIHTASMTQLMLANMTLSATNVYYNLTAINQFGCVNEDSVLVTIKPVPDLFLETQDPQCLMGNKFVFVPGGYVDSKSQLNWSFGLSSIPSSSTQAYPPPVTYSSAGNHAVMLTYSYDGCPAPDIVDTVMILETPPTGFMPSAFNGCAPLTVNFHNTNYSSANNYTWNIAGDTTSDAAPVFTFYSPGTFNVTMNVQNINGCSASPYTLAVDVHSNPTAAFTHTPHIAKLYESIVLFENNSLGGSYYEWDFGDGSTDDFFDGDHMYTDTGTFNITLIVITQNGCRDTVDGVVRVEEGFSFYVPNAFTPNGDGFNDEFQGYGTSISDYEMWIYDRWGLVIYHTRDYDKPWDGRINTMAQNDVYVYRIVVKDRRNEDHVFIGNVTLVK